MHDDDLMDQLLKNAMTAPVPQLPDDFDAKVLQRVERHRLAPAGRAVMAAYAVMAVVVMAWFMRAVPIEWIIGGFAVAFVAAATLSVYVRKFVPG
jgi:hypothetical protein